MAFFIIVHEADAKDVAFKMGKKIIVLFVNLKLIMTQWS